MPECLQLLGTTIVEYTTRIKEADFSLGRGITTGFVDLDRLTDGLQPAELAVIAGVPGIGKTSLAFGIALHAAYQNHTVGLFSLEASRQVVSSHLLTMHSEVDSSRIKRSWLSPSELQKISRASDELSKLPIYVDDSPHLTITQLRERAMHFSEENRLDLIVLDSLQLLEGASNKTRILRDVAKELDIPLLSTTQLTNAAMERNSPHMPILSQLAGNSKSIADLAMIIYREDYYDCDTEKRGIAEVHIVKNRNGPTGVISLLFMERTRRFIDLTIDYQPETRRDPYEYA